MATGDPSDAFSGAATQPDGPPPPDKPHEPHPHHPHHPHHHRSHHHHHHHHHHGHDAELAMTTGPLAKWWRALHRCVLAQLVLSALMQLSYVAFPAYNFALALWCLVCASTAKWFAKHPKLALLLIGALAFSLLTDVIWISLWISGRVFYDQFCGQGGVSIVSCGGASDYFPGCTTNRFALFTLLANGIAKSCTIVCTFRVHRASAKKSHDPTNRATPVAPAAVHQAPVAANDDGEEPSVQV